MNTAQWKEHIARGGADGEFVRLYGSAHPAARYLALLDAFEARFGTAEAVIVSAPGRTEICGNHTDHQRGRVLCAAVTMDTLAVAAPADDLSVTLLSEGYPELRLSLEDTAPRPEEAGTTAALIRGVAAGLRQKGLAVGGLRAVLTSTVLAGGGLSSSASFEILIGALFTRLSGASDLPPMELAKIGQAAERDWFGKPCGLMDQAACAEGGITLIDFLSPAEPAVERIDFDYREAGYVLCAADTRTSHADLTDDYAAIPADMTAVAHALGAEVLRLADPARLEDPAVRASLSPLALDRAEHFFLENERVVCMAEALRRRDMPQVIALMNESGRSSRELLRNVVPAGDPSRNGMAVALDRAEALLRGKGAWRVHGGGFAGCIQCLVPAEDYDAFREAMDGFYGKGACFELRVRPAGPWFLS